MGSENESRSVEILQISERQKEGQGYTRLAQFEETPIGNDVINNLFPLFPIPLVQRKRLSI